MPKSTSLKDLPIHSGGANITKNESVKGDSLYYW